jgi:hypothetical protein
MRLNLDQKVVRGVPTAPPRVRRSGIGAMGTRALPFYYVINGRLRKVCAPVVRSSLGHAPIIR